MVYQKGKCLYGGKASKLYEAADEHGHILDNRLVIERTDAITAKDGEVRDEIPGKGAATNRISNLLFQLLGQHDIPTHYVEELSSCETLIVKTKPVKLEVVVRNIATGSLVKRLPIENGKVLDRPIVEFFYKDDERHDPFINYDHALALEVTEDEYTLCDIEEMAREANDILKECFQGAGITLVDFKLEFGYDENGRPIIIDEISPDTCRLWDAQTGKKLDKDLFRTGQGNDITSSAYEEVLSRLTAALAEEGE